MNFYEDLKNKYAPTMGGKEFSDAVSAVEAILFDGRPELLELTEEEQNVYVEEAYRNTHGRCQ